MLPSSFARRCGSFVEKPTLCRARRIPYQKSGGGRAIAVQASVDKPEDVPWTRQHRRHQKHPFHERAVSANVEKYGRTGTAGRARRYLQGHRLFGVAGIWMADWRDNLRDRWRSLAIQAGRGRNAQRPSPGESTIRGKAIDAPSTSAAAVEVEIHVCVPDQGGTG